MTAHQDKLGHTSTVGLLDGVNLRPHAREAAKADLLHAEAIVDGLFGAWQAVRSGIRRIGQLNAAWRLKSAPRETSTQKA